ncbi:piezo-type mechanosensitive ion channel component-like [Drosophila gunungcola]|uniref:Piezo TM1-24 domain-containing protein n=1 Tax=Drosophila gunungcola TaxID=103775 RepID=A0A9Q0BKV6_9MUSC|nr:piezo-type mechanosensitive ion channel component-like [Drosophila gunungcola]XP_052855261.1 piezo-type mechanosensitive ion channel component-like [Drosophila gunungcola]KAI8035164.1 hypothetical protein M5D96_012053 [Drosophila gunungcola]
MAELVLFILIRFLLPLTLIFVSLVRPVGISCIYLIMFFLSPWLLRTKNLRQRSFLNVFIIILCVLSTICLIGHLLINLIGLFFIDLSSKKSLAFILRQIGFLYFKGLSFGSIAHWTLPDFFIFLETIVYLIFSKIFHKRHKKLIRNDDDGIIKVNKEIPDTVKIAEMNRLLIIIYIRTVLKTSPIFSLIVLYFAASLRPSLPGSLYFLMFIIAGTYWALYRQLNRRMYYPLIFMVVALLIHITCIFAYQLPVLQRSININTIWSRVMGMEILLSLFKENKNGKILELNKQLNLDSYLNPIAVMLAYFASTLSLINRSKYELTFNTIRMNLEPKPHGIFLNTQPVKGKTDDLSVDAEPSMLEQFFI